MQLDFYFRICVHGGVSDKFTIIFKRVNTKDEDAVGLESKYELIVEAYTGRSCHFANSRNKKLTLERRNVPALYKDSVRTEL
jgi:hypothetical protein